MDGLSYTAIIEFAEPLAGGVAQLLVGRSDFLDTRGKILFLVRAHAAAQS
jgi:hypothetical protein